MKRQRLKHCPFAWLRGLASFFPLVTLLAAFVFLGFACKGGRSPNSQNAAPHLEDRTIAGDYRPYYQTGGMGDPRYWHQAIRLKNGHIMVSGGTDERGFAAFDNAEIFDETATRKGELRPPTGTGVWFDTDFEGNPITMEFRRFWHTMTLLPDNRVILFGGASDLIRARPIERVEVYDPETRTFETLEDAKLLFPRARHTATFMPDGTIVIAGGQIHDVFAQVTQGTVSGFGQSGTVTVTQLTDIFPTIDVVEVFSFRDLVVTELTLADSNRPSTLTSSRGRAGHVTARFAGFDNRLKTGDDLFLLVGGFQTPSTGELVPTIKAPRQQTPISLQNLEVYDPTLRLFFQVGTAILRHERVNDPQATNLGVFNDFTPDGVLGMGNVILISHGDNDFPCFTSFTDDEVFAATYTGLGPAQGMVLNRISYPGAPLSLDNGHLHGIEATVFLAAQNQIEVPPFGSPGRTTTNFVPLPRNVNSPIGEVTMSTWVYAGSGAHVRCTPAGPVPYYDGTIGAGTIFDPMYRLIPAANFNLTPRPNARDLRPTRSEVLNPTGVVGTWLALDGKYPSTDRIGFADVAFSYTPGIWPHNLSRRVHAQLIALAGEDGIFDTIDDRVLHAGGGQNAVDLGGEASEPSAEVVLIPRSPP